MFKRSKALVASVFGAAALVAASSASASTLSFVLTDTQGEASTDTTVKLKDIAGGVNFSFAISDALNQADVVAVYMNFVGGVPTGWGVTSENKPEDRSPINWAYNPDDGSVITGIGLNTDNVAAGNIGAVFNLGLAIGSTGSGAGEYFNFFTFDLLADGLDVTDFLGQMFAVRGQTVGPGCDIDPEGCNLSSKEFGTAPLKVDDPTSQPPEVPLPAGIWLLLSAVGAFAVGGLRRKSPSAA